MSSVSNGLYFLTLPLVSVMRVIYRKIRLCALSILQKECRKSLGCALYIKVRVIYRKIRYLCTWWIIKCFTRLRASVAVLSPASGSPVQAVQPDVNKSCSRTGEKRFIDVDRKEITGI